MRQLLPFVLLFGALTLLTATGCDKLSDSKKASTAGTGTEVLLLEIEEIDLIPGSEKPVTVKTGKATTADAPKDSGVTTKVEGHTVTIAAAKDAKEGTHTVTVKGDKGKEAVVKVHVKKGADGK
jgi:hypothetical protein